MVKPRQHQILYKDEGNGAALMTFICWTLSDRAQSFVSRLQPITTS